LLFEALNDDFLAQVSSRELNLVSIELPENEDSEKLLYDVSEQNGSAKRPGYS
jgi:hypothetical protein